MIYLISSYIKATHDVKYVAANSSMSGYNQMKILKKTILRSKQPVREMPLKLNLHNQYDLIDVCKSYNHLSNTGI